tara:strand:+ start:2672 stop:3397 length:726 start_codon:yes stop_codon:yes gene_type:complete
MKKDRSVILVVGCSRGLGKEVYSYLENKNDLIGISRKVKDNNQSKLKVDITNEDDITRLEDFISTNSIRIKGIVLMAGITKTPSETQQNSSLQSTRDFTEIVLTNLISTYSLIQKVTSHIQEDASIILISSIGAIQGFPGNPGYQASKAGIESLARSLSIDLAKKKIRVNCLRLGYFKTDMTKDSYLDSSMREERSNRTIHSRWGEAHEINGCIDFLLSDKSAYMTGSIITIDGGWTIKGL